MIKFKKFTVKEKSTFQYWFYHWLAFNYTAWKLGVWKPKWLLHDIEKPWLKLIWGDYMRVKQWHKHHNKHHIFYGRRNGREEVDYLISDKSKYTKDEKEEIRKNCYPILDYLGL